MVTVWRILKNMAFSGSVVQQRLVLLALALLLSSATDGVEAQPIVPAVISFGDSTIDVGNNNYLRGAVFKANYVPYGENFERHEATGRFSDGKIVTDITGCYATQTYTYIYIHPATLALRM